MNWKEVCLSHPVCNDEQGENDHYARFISEEWRWDITHSGHKNHAILLSSSTHAWKIPQMEKPGGLQFTGSQRVGHDWATALSVFVKLSFYVDGRSSFTGFRFCSLEGIALSSVFSVLHVCVCLQVHTREQACPP